MLSALCRIVHLPFFYVAYQAAVMLAIVAMTFACSKKDSSTTSFGLPPLAKASDAPDFVRALSLLYPQAELYRVTEDGKGDNAPGIIVQKTNHPLGDVVRYYTEAMQRHGFVEATRLVQADGALLQFERTDTKNGQRRELVSIDISQLPYSENLLIRIGRSAVDYSRNGVEGSAE